MMQGEKHYMYSFYKLSISLSFDELLTLREILNDSPAQKYLGVRSGWKLLSAALLWDVSNTPKFRKTRDNQALIPGST